LKFVAFASFHRIPVKKPAVGRGRKKSLDSKKIKKPESSTDEELDRKTELYSKVAGDLEYKAMKEVPYFA